MQLLYLTVLAVGAIALPSLPQAFSDIPSCSYSALASAMNQEGCSTSPVTAASMNCLCNSLYSIGYDVGYSETLDEDCTTDFVQALGTACGVYLTDDTSSAIPSAVQVLASEVGGAAGTAESSYTTTSSSAQGIVQVTATGPSPTATTSSRTATTSSHSLIQVTATGPSPTATTTGPNPLIAGEPSSSNIAGPIATLGLLAPVAALGVLLF